MTYVVLVILIALWAMVLLPPYLKDRRSSSRTFRSMQSGSTLPSSSALGGVGNAQRFLPLQQAATGYSTSAVSSPTGMRTSGVTSLGTSPVGSNVVPLRPVEADEVPATGAVAPVASAVHIDDLEHDESVLHEAWDKPANAGVRTPTSTAAARERRRQVLLGLTGLAFVTLMLALFVGGTWVALHVLVDAAMLGYVILLVRHRQLAADRSMKVEPIRPPVNEQPPVHVQMAPSYLRSGTGN